MVRGLLLVGIQATALLAAPAPAPAQNQDAAAESYQDWRDKLQDLQDWREEQRDAWNEKNDQSSQFDKTKSNAQTPSWGDLFKGSSPFGSWNKPSGSSPFGSFFGGQSNKPKVHASHGEDAKQPAAPETAAPEEAAGGQTAHAEAVPQSQQQPEAAEVDASDAAHAAEAAKAVPSPAATTPGFSRASPTPRPNRGSGSGLFGGLFGGSSAPKSSGSGLSGLFSGYRGSGSRGGSSSSSSSGSKGGSSSSGGSSGSSFSPSKPDAEKAPEAPKVSSSPSKPDEAKEPAAPAASAAPLEASNSSKPETAEAPASDAEAERRKKKIFSPSAGMKWQIVLDGVPDTKATLKPHDAPVWDVDMWDAKKADIDGLHKSGAKVICYFSAGTSESWRPDYNQLSKHNLGKICKEDSCKSFWGGEQWIDPRNKDVWEVMKKRIKMAADKGCDAIDPDNMGMLSILVSTNLIDY